MQTIQISPLQVEKYFLAELSFEVKNDIELAEIDLAKIKTPEIGITANTFETDSENRKWRCELTVQTKDKENAPYSFRIRLVGFFSINIEYSTDKVELLAKTNCPSILYSTSREMLTTTIRRSPFPPVLLPSVMFLEVPNEEKEKIKTIGKKPRLKK
jgi:preprotein translocase subunit SecB